MSHVQKCSWPFLTSPHLPDMFCAHSCMQSLLFCHLCKYCITCVLWSKWWTVSIIDFFPPSIPKKEGRFATNSKVMMMVVVAVDVDDYHDKVVEGDDKNFLHIVIVTSWLMETGECLAVHIVFHPYRSDLSSHPCESCHQGILSLSVSLVTPVNLVNQVSMESILWTQFVWSQ